MSADTSEQYVSLYAILVDGQEVDQDLARRVREVRVLNYLRLPDMCTVTAVFPRGEAGGPSRSTSIRSTSASSSRSGSAPATR